MRRGSPEKVRDQVNELRENGPNAAKSNLPEKNDLDQCPSTPGEAADHRSTASVGAVLIYRQSELPLPRGKNQDHRNE